MEIKITTKQILAVLHIIAWLLFIGLCIDAGSVIFNAVFTLAVNPENAGYFHLSDLYEHDTGNFLVVLLFIFIAGVLKAIIFFLIIQIMRSRQLDPAQPFNKAMGRFLFLVSYLSFGIGLFSFWGGKYADWITGAGVPMPDIASLHLGGTDVWLFMAVMLFIIALLFKRGIEMQIENELTI